MTDPDRLKQIIDPDSPVRRIKLSDGMIAQYVQVGTTSVIAYRYKRGGRPYPERLERLRKMVEPLGLSYVETAWTGDIAHQHFDIERAIAPKASKLWRAVPRNERNSDVRRNESNLRAIQLGRQSD